MKNDTMKLMENIQNNLKESDNPSMLETAIKEEVRYWIQELANENTNDVTGQRALELLDDEAKLDEITNAILDDDDIWETIHIKIEQYGDLKSRYEN